MDRKDYLNVLEEQIRTKRARPMIRREVEAHIEDQRYAFVAEGMTDSEAEEAAVREMGDPVEAGVMLDRIHRPQMAWNVFAGIVLISLMGFLLQAAAVRTASPQLNERDIWQVFLAGGGLWKQAAVIGAGMILMLLVCRIDYSFIGKYAVPCWIVFNILLVVLSVTGPRVNGQLYWPGRLSYAAIPFYAGVLYHFRGKGKKGLAKSVISLCALLVILFFADMLSMAVLVGVTGFILIHAAIYKGWFGSGRRKLYFVLWGILLLSVLICAGAVLLASGGSPLADYQEARIDAWLHPGKYADYDYVRMAAAGAAEKIKDGKSWIAGNLIVQVRNDYFWFFLFRCFGTWKGILLTVPVIGFWILLFRTVFRQKNQLGYMIGLGCVLFLSIETFLYIAMNFRVIPPVSMYMPFFSNGNLFLIFTYFYMGLLLSVCRNSRLIEN